MEYSVLGHVMVKPILSTSTLTKLYVMNVGEGKY